MEYLKGDLRFKLTIVEKHVKKSYETLKTTYENYKFILKTISISVIVLEISSF